MKKTDGLLITRRPLLRLTSDKGKTMSRFEIIYDENNRQAVDEARLREWLCERPFQEEWYGENGLCNKPAYRDEDGSHNSAWFDYVDEVLDAEIWSIKEHEEKSYSWGYQANESATVRCVG